MRKPKPMPPPKELSRNAESQADRVESGTSKAEQEGVPKQHKDATIDQKGKGVTKPFNSDTQVKSGSTERAHEQFDIILMNQKGEGATRRSGFGDKVKPTPREARGRKPKTHSERVESLLEEYHNNVAEQQGIENDEMKEGKEKGKEKGKGKEKEINEEGGGRGGRRGGGEEGEERGGGRRGKREDVTKDLNPDDRIKPLLRKRSFRELGSSHSENSEAGVQSEEESRKRVLAPDGKLGADIATGGPEGALAKERDSQASSGQVSSQDPSAGTSGPGVGPRRTLRESAHCNQK